jgi:starch-binding outer membrane protein, SusD/RagB family
MDQLVRNLKNAIISVSILSVLVIFATCKKEDTTENLKFTDTTVNRFSNPYDAIKYSGYPLLQILSYPLWFNVGFFGNEYRDLSFEYNLNYSFSMEQNIWAQSYRTIFLASGVIDNIGNSSGSLSTVDINGLKGEAYFIRALAYYNLERYFGTFYPDQNMNSLGVPILLNGNYTDNLSRASNKEIHDKIEADLNNASNLLPENWTGEFIGKPTKYSSMAVLAQTHIWFNEFDKAEPLLEQIINSNKFQLQEKFIYNFDGEHENNSESVFELQFSWNGSFSYDENYYKTPSQGLSYFYAYILKITDYAKAWFGNDPRYKFSVSMVGDSIYLVGKPVYISDSSSKYLSTTKKFQTKLTSSSSSSAINSGTNIPLIRLADIYLLYSELQLKKGNTEVAVEYMNKVRRRAYIEYSSPWQYDISSSLNAQQLTDTLRKERFRELYAEGSWWFDVVRWDIGEQEFYYRGFYRGQSEARKIPTTIIDQNPGIEQNP